LKVLGMLSARHWIGGFDQQALPIRCGDWIPPGRRQFRLKRVVYTAEGQVAMRAETGE
jgi:hypothetical protein